MHDKWVTDEERQIVKQFSERVKSHLPAEELARSEDEQTAFLLRWLRARSLNLDKSEEMLLNALKWREENDIDKTLEKEVDPFLRKTYVMTCIGPDKGGRPVYICNFWEWDFRGIANNNKIAEFDLYVQNFFEGVLKNVRINSENRKQGEPPITQFFPILDVKGFPYGQMLSFTAVKKWLHLACTYEAYYPEVLFKAAFINCPSWFPLFISMFKGFLCPRTLNKFVCYSTLEEWKKDLENLIDPEVLPDQFGGTRKLQI